MIDQSQSAIAGYTDNQALRNPAKLAVIVFGDHTRCVKFVDTPFVQGSDGVKVLRPLEQIHPRFAFHALRAVELPDRGYSRHFKFLTATQFPLPPIDEQARIVVKLESLQARSRRAREALDAVPPLLEKLRQSTLAAAFRGDLTKDWRAKNKDVEPATELLKRIRIERRKKWEESELAKMKAKGKAPADERWKAKYDEPKPVDATGLPELPEGWCWATSSELVEPTTVISYGIVLPGEPQVEGVPYIRGQDIENGTILVDQLWRTTPEIARLHQRSELHEGDVLLCIIRHLKVAVVPAGLNGANLTQGTVRLRPSWLASARYLERYLAGPVAQAWMKGRYFGNAMPRINVADARQIPIPLAPPPEQEEILRVLDAGGAALASRLSRLAIDAVAGADTLERAILDKAFRGELVPQDPKDEPLDLPTDTGVEGPAASSDRVPRSTKRPPRKASA